MNDRPDPIPDWMMRAVAIIGMTALAAGVGLLIVAAVLAAAGVS